MLTAICLRGCAAKLCCNPLKNLAVHQGVLDEWGHKLQQCDVRDLHQTHDTVVRVFKKGPPAGREILNLVNDLRSGQARAEDLTPMVVVRHSRKLLAITRNRRLNVLKSFTEEGSMRGAALVNGLVFDFDK